MVTFDQTSAMAPRSERLGIMPATPLTSFFTILIALVVGAALSSGRIVTMVERKPLGDDRDQMLVAAERFDDAASAVGLDAPTNLADRAMGRSGGDEGIFALDPAPTVEPTTEPATAPPATAPPAISPDDPAPADPSSTTPSSTAVPTTTAAPTTTAEPKRVISIDDPLRIWAGGDSLGEYIGQELKAIAEPTGLATVTLDYHIATGLARPDYFDWPARLNEGLLAGAVDGADNAAEGAGEGAEDGTQGAGGDELVVFMVGGNDNQPMTANGNVLATGSQPWLDEYGMRSGLMLDIAYGHEADVVWIGLPPMRDPDRAPLSVTMNAAVEAATSTRSNATFFDPAPLLQEDGEPYAQYVTGPDGELRKARAPDGIHITRTASRWIAQALWDQILTRWTAE